MKRSLLFFLILSRPLFADSLGVNYYSAKNVHRFAQMLVNDQDYIRAIGEYKRLFFISDTSKDSITFKIASCFEKANDFENALTYYHKLIKNYPQSALTEISYYQIAANLYHQNKFSASSDIIDSLLQRTSSSVVKEDLLYLKGINFVYQNEWNNANSHFSNAASQFYDDQIKHKFSEMAAFTKNIQTLTHRKPYLAALLSTIIPGSGKIYCSQTGDGLFSLFLITLTSALSWAGFNDKGIKSIKGWTMGSAASVLYLGNIYGSMLAAERFNDKQLENYMINFPAKIKIFEINY